MAYIGYCRVSSRDQSLARQEALMAELGVKKLFVEKVSGRTTDRPQLQAMLEYVRDGDCVVVESLSRISRSTRDFFRLHDTLREKEVGLICHKERIDTSNKNDAFTELLLGIFASLSAFEVAATRERQLEGIALCKERGGYKGRVRIDPDPVTFASVYEDWKAKKITARAAQAALGLQARTFYRRVAEHEGR